MSILNPDGEARELPVLLTKPEKLKKGDLFRHIKAAGGGYGKPYERDIESVLADVISGKITQNHAMEAYGVVIRGEDEIEFSIDKDSTNINRKLLKQTYSKE